MLTGRVDTCEWEGVACLIEIVGQVFGVVEGVVRSLVSGLNIEMVPASQLGLVTLLTRLQNIPTTILQCAGRGEYHNPGVGWISNGINKLVIDHH